MRETEMSRLSYLYLTNEVFPHDVLTDVGTRGHLVQGVEEFNGSLVVLRAVFSQVRPQVTRDKLVKTTRNRLDQL